MPNWCMNILYITGAESDVARFLENNKGERACYGSTDGQKQSEKRVYPFLFHSHVPVPQKILDRGYTDAGYHWQIKNWGTMWDLDEDVDIINSGQEAQITFETAWAPPDEWLEKVAPMYPELKFRLTYFEPGMVFAGCLVYENGKLTEEHEYRGVCSQGVWLLGGRVTSREKA